MRKRADVALVELGHFSSRARAQAAIEAGLVSVDGDRLAQSLGRRCAADARIAARAPHPWVSRGGVKLEAALDAFGLDPRRSRLPRRRRLDRRLHRCAAGARRAARLRRRRRPQPARCAIARQMRSVVAHEGRDARKLDRATCSRRRRRRSSATSASFRCASFCRMCCRSPRPRAWLVALIKPQFEAGRENIVKGAVKDPGRSCRSLRSCARMRRSASAGSSLRDHAFADSRRRRRRGISAWRASWMRPSGAGIRRSTASAIAAKVSRRGPIYIAGALPGERVIARRSRASAAD